MVQVMDLPKQMPWRSTATQFKSYFPAVVAIGHWYDDTRQDYVDKDLWREVVLCLDSYVVPHSEEVPEFELDPHSKKNRSGMDSLVGFGDVVPHRATLHIAPFESKPGPGLLEQGGAGVTDPTTWKEPKPLDPFDPAFSYAITKSVLSCRYTSVAYVHKKTGLWDKNDVLISTYNGDIIRWRQHEDATQRNNAFMARPLIFEVKGLWDKSTQSVSDQLVANSVPFASNRFFSNHDYQVQALYDPSVGKKCRELSRAKILCLGFDPNGLLHFK